MTPTAVSKSGPSTAPRREIQVTDTGSALGKGLRRFRPRLALGYQQELQSVIGRIKQADSLEQAEVVCAVLDEAEERYAELSSIGLGSQDLLPTLQWLTVLRVIRDLSRQGWRFDVDDEGVLLRAPGIGDAPGGDPEREKESLRRSFAFAREAQLNEPATESFIKTMERRGIHRLFADGAELASRLRSEGTAAIHPGLELIEPRARDAGTGLLLQEVWRYARLYWSIPYQSTPGRNMFFLVRDGAHPDRPLVGIAALGNPVLGLAQRDDYAGWNIDGLRAKLAELSGDKVDALARRLLTVVQDGIEETYSDDIWPNGVPNDWRAEVDRLASIERDSAEQRLDQLQTKGESRDPEYQLIRKAHTAVSKGRPEDVDWVQIARTNLYKRKRAAILGDLLFAREVLRTHGLPDPSGLSVAIDDDDGKRALEIALRRVKQGVIASSVMEIITCGAVPPYRDVLGGKAVALLMMSRVVGDDHAAKYGGQVSLISSALAGHPVERPARLALLTTSSLYAVGSSQYNRLRVPVGEDSVAYRRIGKTQSFGTVHFAPDTVAALSQIARLVDLDQRRINNLFGEGTSPKLRLVRRGLDGLGLSSDVFLRHHSPRLLYAAAVCANVSDLLLGLDGEPDYILPPGAASTELLVEHWRTRWLAPRLERSDVIDRVAQERRDAFSLSCELNSGDEVTGRRSPSTVDSGDGPMTADPRQTFVERLYRSSNSYADRLSQDELDAIHVDLGVDGYLVEQAANRRQIVVTGNPGDGKTHLIERLRSELEAQGAEVITDANACSDDETLDTWARCREEKRPFVLAINEWPLFVLQRAARARDFVAVEEALRQVRSARYFVDAQTPEPPREDVVTIDLSLRDLLAPSVVRLVVERLTDDQFYEGLIDSDPMRINRRALQQPQVQERLADLLRLVAVRLGHVTMRQLVGFIAFLITGGEAAADRLKAGQDTVGLSYSNLAFDGGEGHLFTTVRQVFDPATITHPVWDERLWRGDFDPGDWLNAPPAAALSHPHSGRTMAFRAGKRQFFFEHAEGKTLLDLQPHDEVEFEQILDEGHSGTTALVRDLVLALNRFYEPDFPEKDQDRLLLWQSHRYDVRAPAAFVSLRDLAHQHLRIEPLRFAKWVEDWLPPEQQARRSFALVASHSAGKDIAILELDRELYLTLLEAQRGLGRSSWSRTATRRITRFIDRIDREVASETGVEDLRVRNVDTDLDERFAVQRHPARYQL